MVTMLSLGGCNMVTTQTPMFTVADGAGAPPIRSGVWRNEKPDCQFEETTPQDAWPTCAAANGGVGNPPLWLEAAGDPPLLQIPLTLPYNKGAPPMYVYMAFRSLKLDDKGRVIAMKEWPVKCGPPPPPEKTEPDPAGVGEPAAPPPPAPAGGLYSPSDPSSLKPLSAPSGGETAQSSAVPVDPQQAKLDEDLAKLKAATDKLVKETARLTPTKTPLPGLKMDDQGGCTPDSVSALRNAARASEAWADENSTSHWVRDPKPGDKPLLTPSSLMDAMKMKPAS